MPSRWGSSSTAPSSSSSAPSSSSAANREPKPQTQPPEDQGPLGHLSGMKYDPIRRKYFPEVLDTARPFSRSSLAGLSILGNTVNGDDSLLGRARGRGSGLPSTGDEDLDDVSMEPGGAYSGRANSRLITGDSSTGRARRRTRREQTPFRGGQAVEESANEVVEDEHGMSATRRVRFQDDENESSMGRTGPSKKRKKKSIDTAIRPERGETKMNENSMENGSLYTRRRGLVEEGRHTDIDFMSQRYSKLKLMDTHQLGTCGNECITFLQHFPRGAYMAATDHGKVVVRRSDGEAHQIGLCQQSLIGLHLDIARMCITAVAEGPEPHAHHYRRNNGDPDHIIQSPLDIDYKQNDIFCMSGFDDRFTIGATKTLITNHYELDLRSTDRKIHSDPLSLHHSDHNLVYAGLRAGSVSLEDLRTPPGGKKFVGRAQKGKAIVGVKRLQDSACPFGLVVSAMGNEMLLFDVRFSNTPLRVLEGHKNDYRRQIGFATSHDDRFIFAANSNRGVACWSTLDGTRVIPDNSISEGKSLLSTRFDDIVTSIATTDGGGVDVAVGGALLRFNSI